MKGRTPAAKVQRRQVQSPLAEVIAGSSSAGDLHLQMEHVSLLSAVKPPFSSFQKLLEAEETSETPSITGVEDEVEDKDCILSQDFFCTPDYITPDGQQIGNNFEWDKENIFCPKSPEKSINARKRYRQDVQTCDMLSVYLQSHQQDNDVVLDKCLPDKVKEVKLTESGPQRKSSYVSQSAVALRCRVMPPPCIKNPYLTAASSMDVSGDRTPKCVGLFPINGDSFARYRTDFHEIELIGSGNFSRVFKVLHRLDGCLYAVKQCLRQLRHDTERVHALLEVQALAALGRHENIIGYHTSWLENDQLYIQMELCDRSLAINRPNTPKGGEVLHVLYQVARALHFMHEHGLAHMDVKPENIYIKNGVYKLGDFGCATLINGNLRIEEGDCRYMPQEILNENYEHLSKVDIFSLGASVYELLKGSPLPDSGPHFTNIREGKISLLPGCPMQFQSLIKAMMDPDPFKRPSAKEITESPLFDKVRGRSLSGLSSSVPLMF